MEEARLINASGARWVRLDASDSFGEAIINAKAYQLKVLGILDSWMFNQSTTFTLEQWRSNVTFYVSQYANLVDAWEIYNEPANPAYTLDSANSTENITQIANYYFSMVQTSSPIIRQYDPNATIVLFGGLNLWSGGDPNLALDKEFAGQLATINIQQYGDAISVHAYPWNAKIEPSIWQKYNDSLVYYQGLYPSLEIWLTETGHPANFDGNESQAQYMRDSLQFFHTKVTHFFWYSLTNNSGEKDDFGLIAENGTKRQSYNQLQSHL